MRGQIDVVVFQLSKIGAIKNNITIYSKNTVKSILYNIYFE